MHGEWWQLALSAEDRELLYAEDRELLHSTALEFVALGISTILYGTTPQRHHALLLSDTLATVRTMQKGPAKALTIQAILRILKATPEYAALSPFLTIEHLYGECNPLADAASRGKRRALDALSAQLGVVTREVALSARVLRFVDDVRISARRIRAELFEAAVAEVALGAGAGESAPPARPFRPAPSPQPPGPSAGAGALATAPPRAGEGASRGENRRKAGRVGSDGPGAAGCARRRGRSAAELAARAGLIERRGQRWPRRPGR